jgi:O-antigen ligase
MQAVNTALPDEIGVSSTRSRAGSRSQSKGKGRVTNDILMWCLLVFTALAPLPLGSNRPLFWITSAGVMGLVGAAYFLASILRSEPLRYPLGSLRLHLWLFIVVCLYLLLQTLPLAGLVGLDRFGTEQVFVTFSSISIAPGATQLMLLRMLTYGLFFFLVMQVAARESRRVFMISALLAIVSVYALIGLISLQSGDTILGLPKWAYFGSATGTFVNRNSYATFLAFGACIAAARLVQALVHGSDDYRWDTRLRPSRSVIIGYFVAYVLIISVVIATQSRMGLFVSIAGTLTVIAANAPRLVKTRATAAFALVAALASVGGALFLYGSGVFERIGGLERSAELRTELYRQVVELIAMRPWTGFGGGTFEVAFPLVHRLPLSADLVWDKAHNTYLALWAELGLVIGTLPILMFAMFGFRLITGLLRRRGDSATQIVALSIMAAGALHSLVDFSLEIQAITFIFLMAVALGNVASSTSSKLGSE